MQETAESVKEYGVLILALARPREDGGYELIAGHRRKHACELAGLATMPVIVRDIDRDAATIRRPLLCPTAKHTISFLRIRWTIPK